MGQPQSLHRSRNHGIDSLTGSPIAALIALAIASGQERTFTSLLVLRATAADRHLIPDSWSIMTFGSTPERSATDTALHVASDWLGQPPALPKPVKKTFLYTLEIEIIL
jgi:hypothetical protein